jgi:hypothetical protein
MLKALGRALARVWHRRRRTGLYWFQDQRETHGSGTSERPTGACGTGTRVQASKTARHLNQGARVRRDQPVDVPALVHIARSVPWSLAGGRADHRSGPGVGGHQRSSRQALPPPAVAPRDGLRRPRARPRRPSRRHGLPPGPGSVLDAPPRFDPPAKSHWRGGVAMTAGRWNTRPRDEPALLVVLGSVISQAMTPPLRRSEWPLRTPDV